MPSATATARLCSRFGAPAALLVLAAAAFWPSLGGPFLLDDVGLIVHNPATSCARFLGLIFSSQFFPPYDEPGFYYRPLVTATFMLDRALWGLSPAGFHLTNLLFHAAGSVLAFFVLLFLSVPVPGAFFAAALFCVHPLQTGAVCYISGRTDVLSVFFTLLSLLCFFHRCKTGSTVSWALSGAAFLLALLCKEIPVLLPFVLLFFPGPDEGRLPSRGAVLASRLKLALPFFAALAVYFALRSLFVRSPALFVSGENLVPRLLSALGALNEYLGLVFFPSGLHYERCFPVLDSVGGLLELLVFVLWFGPLLFWVPRLLSSGAVRRLFYFFLLLGAAFYFPVSNLLFPVWPARAAQFLFTPEHFFYFPLLWLSAALGILFMALSAPLLARFPGRTMRLFLLTVPAAVLAACVFLSFRQSRLWTDELGFLRRTLVFEPQSAKIHNGLGVALMQRGRLGEALEAFARSLALDPADVRVLLNIGNIHKLSGRFPEAIRVYDRLLALRPGDFSARLNRAEALEYSGAGSEALHELLALTRDHSSSPDGFNLLGVSYLRRCDYPAAQAAFARALELDPGHAPATLNLGIALRRAGDRAGAEKCFARLAGAGAFRKQALVNLVELRLEAGDTPGAVRWFGLTVKTYPNDPQLSALARRLGEKIPDSVPENR